MSEAPCLALVRPVVRIETVSFAPPSHRPVFVAVVMEVLPELDASASSRLRGCDRAITSSGDNA
jgi:hypothetical protein